MFISLNYLLLSPISLKEDETPFKLFEIFPKEGLPLIYSKFQAEILYESVKNKNFFIIYFVYIIKKYGYLHI